MAGELDGRRALVTGASRGIGRAIARRFARAGATVACAGRDTQRVQRTVDEITAAGGRAHGIVADLSTVEGAQATVEQAVQQLGRLDVLVNNAGTHVAAPCPVHEWTIEEWDRLLDTNLRAQFVTAKAAIPHLLAAGGGSIVHISSVCAITVWPGELGYDVAKAGLNMLSDHIAVEYAAQGIRSNTLMPGMIDTEANATALAGLGDGGAFERELIDRHPTGRFGDVEEVAEATLALSLPGTAFLTGANVTIDGGYSRL